MNFQFWCGMAAGTLKRLLTRKILMQHPNGQVFSLLKTEPTPQTLEQASQQFADHRILNLMPFDEALRVYLASGESQ